MDWVKHCFHKTDLREEKKRLIDRKKYLAKDIKNEERELWCHRYSIVKRYMNERSDYYEDQQNIALCYISQALYREDGGSREYYMEKAKDIQRESEWHMDMEEFKFLYHFGEFRHIYSTEFFCYEYDDASMIDLKKKQKRDVRKNIQQIDFVLSTNIDFYKVLKKVIPSGIDHWDHFGHFYGFLNDEEIEKLILLFENKQKHYQLMNFINDLMVKYRSQLEK